MKTNMGISIENLLKLDILKGSTVLAGNIGLNNKITKVNVMEVPDIIDWVSEGEFLITTAYSIRDNVQILEELIPKLKEKGVSGLGIKVGRYIKELPENIFQLANTINFPIIEVPLSVSHTDIISSILTQVINEQTTLLLEVERYNKEAMEIVIKGGNLNDIAKKMYNNIGNTLAIYENINDKCEIICNENIDKSEIEKIVYKFITSNNYSKKHFFEYVDKINGQNIKRVIIPIIIDKIEYGNVFIWMDKYNISTLQQMIIELYINIIMLEFAKRISIYSMESTYKLEFFDDLLSKNQSRLKRAIEKSKNYKFNIDNKYCVIEILLREWNEDVLDHSQKDINNLVFIVNRLIKSYKNNIIYVERGDRIILLYGNVKDYDPAKIKEDTLGLCKKIYAEALKKITSMEIIVGIGRSYLDISQLYKSQEQAKLIVEHLSKSTTESIIHYDDLGIYRILAHDGLKGELIDFCKDTIVPLVEYDKLYNSELVKTLKQYFKFNGNMKKISEKMYMHYNTIVYRVNKIKAITGLDIDESDNRLNLQIALKILDIIELD
ncbi:PucR family transcriptional regulator ligand-binding domain-containing protein [Clostridium sp. AL.422]|uniref:PucR family transcriptional regulator n=1 Tax=Clostridium TaxID=1485 RepID=UPI00293DE2F6|nr:MULTISPECIES: PucR family transcriptional regulator ligand-binding domain-containing protein [unclassified Clostridium]MDV4151417.1 PucR family transcriptional regulator ligand-binding domain-containing protein [Clostridium sp. AL.422]